MVWVMTRRRAAEPALDEEGFTLIEVLVASVVLVAGMLGVVALVETANHVTGRTLAREGATTLARDLLERARQVPFAEHGTTAFGAALRATLPDAAAATAVDGTTLRLVRRNTIYAATTSSCKVDDPADGVGPHDSSFCDFTDPPPAGGSAAPGAPTGSAVTLKLLGLPISVPLGGALVDTTICGLLGANPIGGNPLLDGLLGRGGAVNGVLALVRSGADVGLCPASAAGEQFAIDRVPADFSKVRVTINWTRSGDGSRTLRQATMIANPEGV